MSGETLNKMTEEKQIWTETIEPKHSLFDLKLKEVWKYKDLVYMFVKRDFIASFKQTILGPLWFFINPLLTTITYLIVFGKIANLPTDGVPQFLFYLAGVTLWNFFSSTLTGISSTFSGNAGIFGKVYFPRLVTPISVALSNFMRLGVQFFLFLCGWGYFLFKGNLEPNIWVLMTPVLIIMMSLFALGLGMIFSALTTKYRDMQMLLGFGVSLFMYLTPVIYLISSLKGKYRILADYNPLSPIFECFKYGWMGSGNFTVSQLGISGAIIVVILTIGVVTFNTVEKTFMDTV